MKEQATYYERKLPHYQPPEASIFIAFRLADSLPREVVETLKREYETAIKSRKSEKCSPQTLVNEQKRYFGKYDQYLDRLNYGPLWLADGRIAKLTAETLHYWDGKRYDLYCYCVMANHVHLLIKSYLGQRNAGNNFSYPLSPVMFSLKRHIAREANKLLHRNGKFWQHESYDHVVRSAKEFRSVVSYILNNPVKAGLVQNWTDYRWSFIKSGIID